MIETFIQAIENKNSGALAHTLIVSQESKYFIPVGNGNVINKKQ